MAVDYLNVDVRGLTTATLAYCEWLQYWLNAPADDKLAIWVAQFPDSEVKYAPLRDCFLCRGFGATQLGWVAILDELLENTVKGGYSDWMPCTCMMYGAEAPMMDARLVVAAAKVAKSDGYGLPDTIN